MKIQDAVFIALVAAVLWLRQSRYFVWLGLLSLLLAMPLFAAWVFFTAERLTWYSAGFIASFILISLLRPHAVQ